MAKLLTPEEIALNNYWDEQVHLANGGGTDDVGNAFNDIIDGATLGGADALGLSNNPQNTFQARAPETPSYNFDPGMQTANAQQNQGFQQQGQLANALTDQANGIGPSLANMQLNQATNQNLAQAAGQAASARGLNPAQAARLAGQNQANIQQQAAGQSAMTKLQEQRSAQSQLGNVLAQQRAGSQGMYNTNVGAFNTQNQGIAQGQLGAQAINAQTAAANTASQQGLIGGILGGLGGGMQMADGGYPEQSFDLDAVGGYSLDPVPSISDYTDWTTRTDNWSPDPTVMEGTQQPATPKKEEKKKDSNFWLNMLVKVGMAKMMMPKNGPVVPKNWAEGGEITEGDALMSDPNAFTESPEAVSATGMDESSTPQVEVPQSNLQGITQAGPQQQEKAQSGLGLIMSLFDEGGVVPGKAEYPGDDIRNDVVPAVLSKEEVVLPRTVTKAPDAPEKAAEFLAGLQHSKEETDPAQEYTSEISQLDDRLARLEKLIGKRN